MHPLCTHYLHSTIHSHTSPISSPHLCLHTSLFTLLLLTLPFTPLHVHPYLHPCLHPYLFTHSLNPPCSSTPSPLSPPLSSPLSLSSYTSNIAVRVYAYATHEGHFNIDIVWSIGSGRIWFADVPRPVNRQSPVPGERSAWIPVLNLRASA